MRRSPIGRLAGLRSHPRRRAALVGLTLAALALAPAVASAATPTVSMDVQYGTCHVSGKASTSGTVEIKLRSAGGVLLESATAIVANGRYDVCLGDRAIVGGVRLAAFLDDVKRNAFTVPKLGLGVNRVTDVITVKASAGTALHVTAFDCANSCSGTFTKDLVVPASGTWSKDITSWFDVHGWDNVALRWSGPNATSVDFQVDVPHLEVSPKRVQVFGQGNPGKAVTVWLKDGDGQTRGSFVVTAGPTGWFVGTIRSNGIGVKTAPGDVVSSDIAADAIVKVDISLTFLPGLPGKAVGHCIPNHPYRLSMADSGGSLTLFGTANGTGDFAIVNSQIASFSGATAVLSCRTPAGDILKTATTIP